MRTNKYTSVNRILSKLRRDLGISGISETDVIEWIGEALEGIGAVKAYEESVHFVEVKNHQAALPKNLHAIIQIAKNNCWSKQETKSLMCPAKVTEEVSSSDSDSPDTPVRLDCDGVPIDAYELAYYRPYFDLVYEYQGWCNTSLYETCFIPIRLSNHSFFNSIVCTENDTEGLYNNVGDEYTIVEGKFIRTSFKEGMIAISYLRQKLDDNGYPMIPDNYSYITAITKYITYKLMERHFYSHRKGSETRLQKSEYDWHWYCKQAVNESMMPKGVDEFQNLMEQRQYLLPRLNRYYGFFGKLGKQEERNFNDPNQRNRYY